MYFDRYTEHRMGALHSPDLEHWTDIPDSIDFPEGTRHGSVLVVSEAVLAGLLAQPNP